MKHAKTFINDKLFENDPGVINKPQDEFLFVGPSQSSSLKYSSFFNECLQSTNLMAALNLLKKRKAENKNMPELIILDIPLNYNELTGFKNWLKQSYITDIPIIYNEAALKVYEIQELYKLKLVDDVVNLASNFSKLHYKVKFIKKIADKISLNQTLTTENQHNAAPRGISFVKRSTDIILSLIAIIFVLPLFAIIALCIRLESKGPIFYAAKRAGKGFKIFKFYKFRTMIVDADKKISELSNQNIYGNGENAPAFFKIKDDPRITKVGAFLRNTSLDELPQLFNVLKGDMSIVGNRPLPLYEATSLTTDEWAERFMAPAGITGLWQVSKRGKENMSPEERIILDIDYARNHSLKGDLRIMLQTPTALMQKSNV